jgi:hypothetical protein
MAINKSRIERVLSELPEDLQRQVLEFAEALAQRSQNVTADGREFSVRSHFGIWDSGNPHSADNYRIDKDLAREYASPHKAD